MRRPLSLNSACLALSLALQAAAASGANDACPPANSSKDRPGLLVQDRFDRTINDRGLVLVDWEGYLANPAIQFYLAPPPDATFPATAVLTSKEPRLYFDLPSTAGGDGPRKEIVWRASEKKPVLVSVFPDRDDRDEEHPLTIDFTDAGGRNQRLTLPLHVVDQDRERADDFRVAVDFSQDRTGFFADEEKRATILQAAGDWAYFFADMRLDPVAAGAEKTLIWGPDGFKTTSRVVNSQPYTGYLLYAYGIRNDLQSSNFSISPAWKALNRNPAARNIRSGGEPSPDGDFQVAAGRTKPIRRSGGLEIEIQGNYNTLGWLVSLADEDWWRATNHGDVKNDLYSIAHHEIGHALIFNPNNTLVKRGGKIDDARVGSYLGSLPPVSQSDHLEGVIDPESMRGAFGNEYHGKVPRGRWLITRLDLLCAQAIGYELRPTSAFAPLSFAATDLAQAKVAVAYSARLEASGGIPNYCWRALDQLPDGLSLNSFTGEINGTPTRAGKFEFSVQVGDYSVESQTLTRQLRLVVGDNR
ncbi:MAG TPA: putative Ig domain-containing protein [Pirellulales bacterium]|nr:putative Ig domain-containing protein [Pirellulales bacterium]